MSNLHKDLSNSQIHNPKDFDTAAVSTKLTKNASGNLEWVADSGGGGVTQIIAGTGITISPVGGTGAVTVSETPVVDSPYQVAVHNRCYGSLGDSNVYTLTVPSGNNEHKFTTDLGATGTTEISPKLAVGAAIYSVTKAGEEVKTWVGHVYGTNGMDVKLTLWHMAWGDCQSANVPVEMCQIKSVTLGLTGNNTPICFAESSITNECSATALGDIFILTAENISGEEMSFAVETTMRIK